MPQACNDTAPLARPNFEQTHRFHISDRAGFRVNSFRRRAALDFRRAQKSLRDAGARIQSRARALRTVEQNDHVRPHQRPASQFAGRHRLEPTDSRRRSSRVIRRQAIATWSALHPVHQDSGPIIAGCFRAKHVRWQQNFGSSLVTLSRSSHADAASAAFDGVLGLDILFRHKALINCRTNLVFFKVDQARRINLGSVAASEKFTRVPIQREETGALTVPCSIRGQPTRLLVDTGAFVTIFNEGFVKSLGLAAEPTRISAQFGPGASKRINAAKLDDFNIGVFKVPSEKFGVAPLPQFALQQGSSKIAGILGMDTLYTCHAIIDLDGMGLFLK